MMRIRGSYTVYSKVFDNNPFDHLTVALLSPLFHVERSGLLYGRVGISVDTRFDAVRVGPYQFLSVQILGFGFAVTRQLPDVLKNASPGEGDEI